MSKKKNSPNYFSMRFFEGTKFFYINDNYMIGKDNEITDKHTTYYLKKNRSLEMRSEFMNTVCFHCRCNCRGR